MDDITNIVAKGTRFERKGDQDRVHNVLLGANHVRVSVDEVFKENALLPVPVGDELVTVQSARGSQVAWPKDFVLNDIEVKTYIVAGLIF